MKVRVVDELLVVRPRAALEQQLKERLSLRVRRRVFFAFTGDARQRCVVNAFVSAGIVRVWIGTAVEQRSRDGDGVLAYRGERESTGTQVQKRRPSLRTAFLGRGLWMFREESLDPFQIAAHDARVEILVGDLRVPSQ